MKYHCKLLVSNLTFVTLKSLFVIENLPLQTFWVEFPSKKYKQQPSHIRFLSNSDKA